MSKPNPIIQQAVTRTITRMIVQGQLLTPEQADKIALENLKIQTAMMTIAVNQACGIGKMRFERDVQPILDGLYRRWTDDCDTVDREYADERVRREYEDIMREDVDQSARRKSGAPISE